MSDFLLHSPAFEAGASIPGEYTCEGADVSPPLAWTGAPTGTQSLALIVDDPDAPDPAAPKRVWVHWVVFNIPADATGIPKDGPLPGKAACGLNDWGQPRYGGPCPPIGRHRYFFTLYALDTFLTDLVRPSKSELEAAMSSRILARAQLMGTYAKSG